jgi:hypothetical protein
VLLMLGAAGPLIPVPAGLRDAGLTILLATKGCCCCLPVELDA